MEKQSICIIGAGNLGQSLAKGLISQGFPKSNSLYLTRRKTKVIEYLAQQNVTITDDNELAISKSNVVILAVQPSQAKNIIAQFEELLKSKLVISLVTALGLDQLEELIGHSTPIVRAMPNTAAAALQSMTCLSFNKQAQGYEEQVQSIFNCMGESLVIEESLMQAATVMCASGIAFWMRIIRATMQGGIQLGFDAEDARKIAVNTCLGAASLLKKEDQNHPEAEIDKVTTPLGCTITGLNEMEHNGLSSALIKGLNQSFNHIKSIQQSVQAPPKTTANTNHQ